VGSISSEQRDNGSRDTLAGFVTETAVFLQRRGWSAAALLLIEAGGPLAFLGGQLVWLAQPLLSFLFSPTSLHHLARLLEEPAALKALHQQLLMAEEKR
jgi:hypothetical protein